MQKIGDYIGITVPDELKNGIDRVAKRHNLTRAEAARRILTLGLEFYEDFENIGVPQLVEMIKKGKQAIVEMKQRRLV